MIHFACPNCRKALKTLDQGAGRKISCPQCGQRLLVPQPQKPAAGNPTVLGEFTSSPLLGSTPSAHAESDSLTLLGLRKDAELEGTGSNQPDYRPARSWIGTALAALALILAAAAIPASVFHDPLLGAGLAGVGVLLSVLSLFFAISRPKAGWIFPLVHMAICGSLFLAAIILLGKGAESEDRLTHSAASRQNHKDAPTTGESKQPDGAASQAEQRRPDQGQRQEASRRTQRHEDEEKSEPKDDGRPRFDSNDLQRTVRWGCSILEKLQKDASNDIRYRATLEKLREDIRVHEGAKVRWTLVVGKIGEDSVTLFVRHERGLFFANIVRGFQLTDSANRFDMPYQDQGLSLIVGPGISKEKAARLNPGDKISVSAKIDAIVLEHGYIRIVLKELRAE